MGLVSLVNTSVSACESTRILSSPYTTSGSCWIPAYKNCGSTEPVELAWKENPLPVCWYLTIFPSQSYRFASATEPEDTSWTVKRPLALDPVTVSKSQ